jgi:predicted nucleic acid-binding Zn ribbon protein
VNPDDSDPAGSSAASAPSGSDIARRALEEARAQARANGKAVGRGKASPLRPRSTPVRRSRGWSGPGPDGRDPQLLGGLASAIARSSGWSEKFAEGTVFGRWPAVVGDDVASHCVPTALRERVLHVSAESTAWATQLRMLQSQILARIAAAVGDGVVTGLRITGPAAPSWRKGDRHVPGRGPRDTYG